MSPVRLLTERDAYARGVADVLRELLARAEAGEFVAATVVLDGADGTVTYRVTGTPDYARTIGQLHLAATQLARLALP